MIQVELVYDRDCPNIREARERLLRAFAQLNLTPQWTEWARDDSMAPDYAKRFASPTVLVNRRDVAGEAGEDSVRGCRVYPTNQGYEGAPSVEDIQEALKNKKMPDLSLNQKKSYMASLLAALPSVGLAALPKLTCAACWPAYAGLLSAMGVPFMNYTPYLLPAVLAFLSLSLFLFYFRARTRRGLGPFWTGLAAAMIIIPGKFYFDIDFALYLGAAMLSLAAVWNAWPKQSDLAVCKLCGDEESKHSV